MIKAKELDDNQKQKLVEICKHVYGKNRFFWDETDNKIKEQPFKLSSHEKPVVEKNGILWMMFENSIPEFKTYEIHWLDFCLNVLPKEIFRKEIIIYGQGHIQHHITKMTSGEWNPVNYLHKQLGLDRK